MVITICLASMSLIVAIICFKFLSSEVAIENKWYCASGGLAGFVVSFGLLGRYCQSLLLKCQLGSEPVVKDKESSEVVIQPNLEKDYDLFVSAPITSVGKEEYQSLRNEVLVITQHFKTKCDMQSIHYVGERVESSDEAEPPAISIEDDLKNLSKSKRFILIYPEPLLTSCIVEAGFALALGVPSIYFVKNRKDLPYMLQGAESSPKNAVSIYEYKDADDLIRLIDRLKNRLFKES